MSVISRAKASKTRSVETQVQIARARSDALTSNESQLTKKTKEANYVWLDHTHKKIMEDDLDHVYNDGLDHKTIGHKSDERKKALFFRLRCRMDDVRAMHCIPLGYRASSTD